jgi:hypothetical protein
MDNKKSFFVVNKHTCGDCKYSTQRKFDYDKHTLTAKHFRIINDKEIDEKVVGELARV